MLKRTALFEEHQTLNGRMVDFGGWELPVQYSGVLAEHLAVRNQCGIFDVSHMGEIWVEGPGSAECIDYVTTNEASALSIGQAQYSAFCNERGGIVDDLVVYRLGAEKFLLVVNASNTDKDYRHLEESLQLYSGVKPSVRNASSEFSQIAIQGPRSEEVLQKIAQSDLSNIKTYWCAEGLVSGARAIIARTGYTGEDGFELYVPWSDGPKVWTALLDAGKGTLLPCGLGARDTLRLEMKYALYGHELSDDTNPLEVGLGWITKLKKPGTFIGRPAIEAVKVEGPKKALVGLKSEGRAIARQGYGVFDLEKNQIGIITSGTQSPSIKLSIAVGFLDRSHEAVGSRVLVKIRDEFHEFVVCKTPFINKK